jgi:hypothetical protein
LPHAVHLFKFFVRRLILPKERQMSVRIAVTRAILLTALDAALNVVFLVGSDFVVPGPVAAHKLAPLKLR